jgi:type II secretory pathway pseudopilin PulG
MKKQNAEQGYLLVSILVFISIIGFLSASLIIYFATISSSVDRSVARHMARSAAKAGSSKAINTIDNIALVSSFTSVVEDANPLSPTTTVVADNGNYRTTYAINKDTCSTCTSTEINLTITGRVYNIKTNKMIIDYDIKQRFAKSSTGATGFQGGDGFDPIVINNKVYSIWHRHGTPSIACISIATGDKCHTSYGSVPGYPFSKALATPVGATTPPYSPYHSSLTEYLGKIYYPAAHSGDKFTKAVFKVGIGCYDTVLESDCSFLQLGTNFYDYSLPGTRNGESAAVYLGIDDLYRVGTKAYILGRGNKMYCAELSSGTPVACPGQPYTLSPSYTMVSQDNGIEFVNGGYVSGTMILMARHFFEGSMAAFETTTNTIAWVKEPVSTYGAFAGGIFSVGSGKGCWAPPSSTWALRRCFNESDGSNAAVPSGLFASPPAVAGTGDNTLNNSESTVAAGNVYVPLRPYGGAAVGEQVYCWNQALQIACPGFGLNGFAAIPALNYSVPGWLNYSIYKIAYNNGCLILNSGSGLIFSMDGTTGAIPCTSAFGRPQPIY